MVDNWFDPPDPDANLAAQDVTGPGLDLDPRRGKPRRVYIHPPLDPSERVAGGFGAMHVEDRRFDSPLNYLPQGPAQRNFLNRAGPYQTPLDPTYPAEFAPPVDPRDVNRPLSVAAGVRELEAYQRPMSEFDRKIAELAEERRVQMEEYNKRQELKRAAQKRREAGAR